MGTAVRLTTWNVESIRAHLDQVLGWVDANSPDVVCLQETRADRRRFPTAPFEARGYEVIVCGGAGGQGGVALATRLDPSNEVLGIPGAVAPLDELRSISVTVGGLRVHTVYGPNGRKVGTRQHDIKLAWFKLLTAWVELEAQEHLPRIVAGDLNIAPTDLDVWDPARYRRRNLTSPPERKAFVELCDRGDLVDVVRAAVGERRAYTWWNRRSDFFASDRGWRLDHVLADPQVAERVGSVQVDRDERANRNRSTDHVPITVVID